MLFSIISHIFLHCFCAFILGKVLLLHRTELSIAVVFLPHPTKNFIIYIFKTLTWYNTFYCAVQHNTSHNSTMHLSFFYFWDYIIAPPNRNQYGCCYSALSNSFLKFWHDIIHSNGLFRINNSQYQYFVQFRNVFVFLF